ncbi:TonB-linked SusC/RagA family outer membrane protein [Dyadobacter jejuensis]|uniref:TonB-linked SusC/RagA family outer membrane protein n=1 Tax=Dyadobacter jejuensis TaxID=1082580 RepID=A0A316ABU2_9BACT|nr:SusC/RagA family TonB-linked outer membrane protein [Dyadobacter jejuensis]PWJ55246.1 TonB-linked SusC/RagA family outer membrane protein [Dyadobacter jejuensis]
MKTTLRTLFFLTAGLMVMAAPLLAQSYTAFANLDVPKTPHSKRQPQGVLLKDYLKEVEAKYRVSIAYSTDILKDLRVNASVQEYVQKQAVLEHSLNKILKEYDISYRKSGEGFYILYPTKPKQVKDTPKATEPTSMRLESSVKHPDNIPAMVVVAGTVTDIQNGEGIPGVNILLKDTNLGTVSAADGSYRLELPDQGGVLVFSYIGYVTQEVLITNQNKLDIQLQENVNALSEVVVTALGIAREEKSLGYSIQNIDTKGINEARETNFVNSMQGKVAGVQITGASGNIGGSSRITIRGSNSVSGNNQPLFVVDGTPMDNSSSNSVDTQSGQGGRDYGNAAQDINPDDIASISVLKGPSAAALYGSRASNGVILITTKSGQGKQGLGITFNSSTTLDKVYMLPSYQNQYGGGFKQTFDTYNGDPVVNLSADESWGPKLDGQLVRQWDSFFPGENYGKFTPWVAHPDNVKNFYLTGKTFSNNIALVAGGEQANLRISYTNVDQKGTLPNSSMKRNTFSINSSAKLSPKLTASVKANYVNTYLHGRPVTGDYTGTGAMSVVSSFSTWFQRQVDLSAMRDYRAPDGSLRNWNLKGPDDLTGFYWNNPYFELYENYSDDTRQRIFGNISLAYEVTPHLTVTGFARTDFYDHRIQERTAEGHVNGSMYLSDNRKVQEYNYEFLAQYNRELGTDISFAMNVGANARREKYNQNYGRTNGGLNVPNFFNLQASVDRPDITDYYRARSVNSVYGSATVGFRDLLYLEGSLRNDWSSTLPINNNAYLYPAASSSVVFSELLSNWDFLSFGKLRASWAKVGNDTDPYRLGITYSPNTPFGSHQIFNVPDVLNNAVLKPEQTHSYEIGTDLRFFGSRLGFDATYYFVSTTDQILDLPVSSTTGYGYAIVNAGKITNRGFEVMLTGTPVKADNGFKWDVVLNWARNQNEVVFLADGQDNYQLATSYRNLSINARVGQSYGALIGTGFKLNDQGERLVDSYGYYMKETGKVLGNTLPDFTGGVSNSFSYKNLTVSALVDFRKGGKIYSVTNATGTYAGLLAVTAGNNDKGNLQRSPVSEGGGWRADGVLESGEPNTTYIDAQNYWKDIRNINEASVFDGSFIKLREVRVGYRVPKRWISKTPFQNLSLSLVGRNLAVFLRNTDLFDPETTLGSGNIQGIESAQLPSVRSLGFNLNVSF